MLTALKTKRARAGLVVLVLLALTGAAVAYFTTTGSGSGTAQVGTSQNLTINATITPPAGGIVPGGTPAAVAFTVNNPSSGNQYVGTVSLHDVQAYSDSAHNTNITGTGAGQCDTSQFTMAAVTENQNVASGNNIALNNGGQLVFHDSGSNQDACKGAYLVANFTSN
jgi:hypothetical protein